MNNDLEQFSEKRLQLLADYSGTNAELQWGEIEALARIALAAKQAKPVAWKLTHVAGAVSTEFNKEVADLFGIFNGNIVEPLYTTPQQAHTEQAIADGWVIAPRHVTSAMAEAGKDIDKRLSIWKCQDIYQAMLAAAPKPESE